VRARALGRRHGQSVAAARARSGRLRASLDGARRAEDQLVVRLDDVHGPVEALLHQDLEAVTLDQPIVIARLVGQGESDAAPRAGQSDRCRWVEPAGSLVGSLKDLCRPLRELDHGSMLAKVRVGPAAYASAPPSPDLDPLDPDGLAEQAAAQRDQADAERRP
jgi:hypothetical protein